MNPLENFPSEGEFLSEICIVVKSDRKFFVSSPASDGYKAELIVDERFGEKEVVENVQLFVRVTHEFCDECRRRRRRKVRE